MEMMRKLWMGALIIALSFLGAQAGQIISSDDLWVNGGAISGYDRLVGWTVTETGADVACIGRISGEEVTYSLTSSQYSQMHFGNYYTGTRVAYQWFRDGATSMDTHLNNLNGNSGWVTDGDSLSFTIVGAKAYFTEGGGMSPGENWLILQVNDAPVNYTGYTEELGGIREIAIQLTWADNDSSGTRSVGDVYTIGSTLYATGDSTFNGGSWVDGAPAVVTDTAPTGLTVTPAFSAMNLDWDDVSDPSLDSYNVYRSFPGFTNYAVIASNVQVSAYTDSPTLNATNYYYKVTWVDTSGSESFFSEEVVGYTPVKPVGLVAEATNNAVILDWTDSLNPDVAFYTVYSSLESGTNYTVVASNVLMSAYMDATAVKGVKNYYVVTETDTSGTESDRSAQVSAAPYSSELIVFSMTNVAVEGTSGSFDGVVAYPQVLSGQVSILDPLDGSGRMDRFYMNFDDSNKGKVKSAGLFYAKADNLGFVGTNVLSTTVTDYEVQFTHPADTYFGPTPSNTIFWLAAVAPSEFGNDTEFNDIAYGFRVNDLGVIGAVDIGDTLELLGVIYSTGTESVFGKTADDLTAMLNLDASPFDTWGANFGLSGTQAEHNADPDSDGVKNLEEYAFGGNPTNALLQGKQPWVEGNLLYIYRLVDDSKLSAEVVTFTDITTGGGTNLTVTPAGSGAAAEEGYIDYTNTVDTSEQDLGFLKLELTYE